MMSPFFNHVIRLSLCTFNTLNIWITPDFFCKRFKHKQEQECRDGTSLAYASIYGKEGTSIYPLLVTPILGYLLPFTHKVHK
jgi:hypothetical protein